MGKTSKSWPRRGSRRALIAQSLFCQDTGRGASRSDRFEVSWSSKSSQVGQDRGQASQDDRGKWVGGGHIKQVVRGPREPRRSGMFGEPSWPSNTRRNGERVGAIQVTWQEQESERG